MGLVKHQAVATEWWRVHAQVAPGPRHQGRGFPKSGALLVHPGSPGATRATGPPPLQACVKRDVRPRQASHCGPFPPFCKGPARCAHQTQQEGEQMMTTIFAIISVIGACISAYAAFSLWKR